MRWPVRLAAWVLKAAGFLLVPSGIVIWSYGHPVWAVAAMIFGFGVFVAGALVEPGPDTGAGIARNMMELYDDMHYVRPPGGNLTDRVEGDDGRFGNR